MPGATEGGAADGEAKDTAPVIVWFRRDLRLDDNPALLAAAATNRPVLAVFLWEPEEHGQFRPGRCARWWLNGSLARLEHDLAAIGAELVYVRCTTALEGIRRVVATTNAKQLFYNNLYDAVSLARDCALKNALVNEDKLGVYGHNGDLLYEPWEVYGSGGEPFHTFESFWSRVQCMPYAPPRPEPAPARLLAPPKATLEALCSAGVTTSREGLELLNPDEAMCAESLAARWSPGSSGALRLLDSFCRNSLPNFTWERAKIDVASTSQLSPHLHYGEISVRRIYYVIQDLANSYGTGESDARLDGARLGDDTPAGIVANRVQASTAGGNAGAPRRMLDGPHGEYLRCLGLREWSRYLSFFYPFTHERSLLSQLRAVPWNYDQALFQRWRVGTTGYPLVDAAMRQLFSTGWLHNRMRMVVASFLVKHLLLPWQWGLRHFWEAHIDADLEEDVLGWQYVSGCLADGHSFMIQIDLDAEARRFDPNGNYVRRWITQLSRLPTRYVHAPWRAPPEVLEASGVELGGPGGYPLPIVDADASRERLQRAAEHLRNLALEQADKKHNRQNSEITQSAMPRAASPAQSFVVQNETFKGVDVQSLKEHGLNLGEGVLAPTLCEVAESPNPKRRRIAVDGAIELET